ncbi:sulfate ABC transporter substrate-binding protein [Cohnella kolymensis]|uniref:Sulfate ABC transporter substrate-binding protein n=1 Tax=Cohnella kolymensis TaxID=1590652 RepID=A0ABR5A4D7_9BACL|nr:sulfate ABC transporter substrate-binding protein [Cohnella kolymensis]KIL35908.1 sulfate ABC transporter substrate-binding protein [Cohnella kolymensis]
MKAGNRKHKSRVNTGLIGIMVFLILFAAGCGAGTTATVNGTARPADPSAEVTLVIGAYSVAKDALGDILPAFKAHWKAQTGQDVTFQESYEASGTQARAIVGGFEADVTLLAMEGDMDKLVKAGLLREDWNSDANRGMVSRSIVVLGTRPGNPLGIRDFNDLTRPGIKILYPNPKTSGGAQWDINAIYGAGLKLSEKATGTKDPAAAKKFLKDIHRNIESMDKSGRASMAAFEYGVGDVIVTYENELLARLAKGVRYDIVVPSSTILIENPAAVVDRNADRHGVREAADGFVEFLRGQEAQQLFAKHGFRPVSEEASAQWKHKFPEPPDLFDINYLGGWDEVRSTLYSKRGVWYQVLAGN